VRSSGGELLQQARQQPISPQIQTSLQNAGVSYTPSIVPNKITTPYGSMPLTGAEQTSYQQLANAYRNQNLATTMMSGTWITSDAATRTAMAQDAVSKADAKAAQETLRFVSPFEQQQRVASGKVPQPKAGVKSPIPSVARPKRVA
jgi:type IV secretory pathway TrbL component